MTQASKIQDEPSMEEILASIRRIIEDSDSAQGQGVAVSAVANDHPAVAPAPADRTPAESRSESLTSGEGQRDALERPAIRVAEAVRPKEVPEPRPERPDTGTEGKADPEAVEIAADPGPLPVAPEARKAGQWRSEASPPVRRFFDKAEKKAEPEPVKAATPERAASAPLVSEQAGLQVAAAFDELSSALEETRRREFGKMAEEMMRPMLRDWLNDHLPGLVERLVREEIARITQGKSH